MVSAIIDDAIARPAIQIQQLYQTFNPIDLSSFPAAVARHFSYIFQHALNEIPPLCSSTMHATLVSFRAMVQDTSSGPDLYLARDGSHCTGWGISDMSHNTANFRPEDLRERLSIWATSIPSESGWCNERIGVQDATAFRSNSDLPHKYPIPLSHHVGAQVKVYDMDREFKPTDLVIFVGILTSDPIHRPLDIEDVPMVPTVHVVFSRPIPDTIVVDLPFTSDRGNEVRVREELISWIADEALDGDRLAAEWILLVVIARVQVPISSSYHSPAKDANLSQSRTPALLPPSLVLSNFPSSSIKHTAHTQDMLHDDIFPTLSHILEQILPTFLTIPLTLSVLNSSPFRPEDKEGDLHSGWLQLPNASTVLLTEQEITEGTLNERGIDNLRAIREVMSTQMLDYVFPYSRFSFPTDVSLLVTTENSKSVFFQTMSTLPLAKRESSPLSIYYKPKTDVKMPSEARLKQFRNLIIEAKSCTERMSVSDSTSKYIQDDFVEQRQTASFTPDDLLHLISLARLLAISFGQKEITPTIWERAKGLNNERNTRFTGI